MLFEFWKTKQTGAFIASLIIIFIMAFVYEGLKFWRDKMLQKHRQKDPKDALDSSSVA